MKYALIAALLPLPALADAPVIEAVTAKQSGSGWNFSVTLSHPDTGWDDYADGWRVENLDGDILGTRVLAHPHVNEQPFTRSLGRVTIPDGTMTVNIRASDNVGGWAEETMLFELPK